jgi:hypothetical protein
MKHVTVSTTQDTMLELKGDPLLDTSERTLIVQGDNGSYIGFNWDHVEFFIVQSLPEGEDDDE